MGERVVTVRPGPPAVVAAVAAPAGALALVAASVARGAMAPGADDPVSPWVVAAVTVAAAAVLSWRSLTQSARLDDVGITSRSVAATARVAWDDVEELRVVRRGPLVWVEVRVSGLRRTLHLAGSARAVGSAADELLARLSAHPRAGSVLEWEAS